MTLKCDLLLDVRGLNVNNTEKTRIMQNRLHFIGQDKLKFELKSKD